jgi:hypothetical protein
VTARAGSAPPVVAVAAAIVDAPAMASVLAAAAGITPRQLREIVEGRGTTHVVWRRHRYVRMVDLVRALGLGADAATTAVAEPAWDDGRVIAMVASRRAR